MRPHPKILNRRLRPYSGDTYEAAIAHLTEVVALLNRPGEGMGVAWGLRRGQIGWFHVVRCRNELERLRDELVKFHERGEA